MITLTSPQTDLPDPVKNVQQATCLHPHTTIFPEGLASSSSRYCHRVTEIMTEIKRLKLALLVLHAVGVSSLLLIRGWCLARCDAALALAAFMLPDC